jgi:CheY-like chemotaxis protein
MPEVSGLEATVAIRKWEQDTGRRTPIIALTARAMKGDEDRCLEVGMDGYLSKPIRMRDLITTIDRVLAPRATGVDTQPAPVMLEGAFPQAQMESPV